MARIDTLKSMEIVLESFLDRAVGQKQDRIRVLDGINRLDDLARGIGRADGDRQARLTDRIGEWFAEHRGWAQDPKVRPAERNRINRILGEIGHTLEAKGHATPATQKITSEIERWRDTTAKKSPTPTTRAAAQRQKIVLRRGPEAPSSQPSAESQSDSLTRFMELLERVAGRYRHAAGRAKHLMTVLDDNLNAAYMQRSREALVLAAMIIYHLKQSGYLVEPFVKRLKEAERRIKQEAARA